jgi:hypothetical protein
LLFILPLTLQQHVCFGYLNQVIPNPNQHKFFPIFHIHRLQIVTHINQPSYFWSSRPATSFRFHSYISLRDRSMGMQQAMQHQDPPNIPVKNAQNDQHCPLVRLQPNPAQ